MTPSPIAGTGNPDALPPHAPLPLYYNTEAEHQAFLRRIFDSTAADYDRIEAVLAFGTGPSYRRDALTQAGLTAGAQVLDVGIGTGLVAREALKLIGSTGKLTGVDPSVGMMGQVRLPGVELIQGVAEALPRPDASCDFVSMGYAMRHISDVAAAFSEFHRVLRPGGRVVVLEITKPEGRIATALLKGYMRAVVPLIARVVGRRSDTSELWRYYWDTIEACIPPERVMQALGAAGFSDVRRHASLGVFSAYTGRKPESTADEVR
ncbi:demethylmenaquinone methyltransferase/2-methoxy-6-polyprenyl-1,4-benzoquinol methylase [Variovorax boronicumulans]|uniref:class I SAM-dependent methyltransferase n=1 Tax=Variovorax boronicumulans TaxID=436515 RepID=UPI00278A1F34|nr:class I SAM-dependent methyltransferase [Variovorax boronicumulans]MDP9908007.1 demethylmenaquinone methyltransferase/2-methoxy-6-polyprenyl-1,4-benzoquinol methylase [Variovorax boronicumulans]